MASMFDAVHAACQAQMEQAAAQQKQGGWLPAPGWRGTYVLEKVDEKNGTSDNGPFYVMDATFKILDGEHKDRNFRQSFFCAASQYEGPSSGVRNLCSLASCLAGEIISDFAKGISIVKGGMGAAIEGRTAASKTGKVNVYHNKRLDKAV